MTKFRRVLCFILMIPMLFVLVGCGKKDDDKNKGNQGGSSSNKKTAAQIMKFVASSFETDANNNVDGTYSFSSRDGNNYNYSEYDSYVYFMFEMLEEISSSNLVFDAWKHGRIISSAPVLTAKQVSKFYAKQVDNGNKTTISIYTKLLISGREDAKFKDSFALVSYNIEFNHATEEFLIDCYMEKSLDTLNDYLEVNNSIATYYYVSYNSKNIIAQTFKRIIDVDESFDTMVNKFTIVNIKNLSFNMEENIVIGTSTTFNKSNTLSKLQKFKELETFIENGSTVETTLIEDISEIMIKFVNAEKISDVLN